MTKGEFESIKGAIKYTEHYYATHEKTVRVKDKKLADKLVKISEAAKDASEYIKSREA